MTVFWRAGRNAYQYDFVIKGRRFQGFCRDADGQVIPKGNRTAALAAERAVRAKIEANGPPSGALPHLPAVARNGRPEGLTLAIAGAQWLGRVPADSPSRPQKIRHLREFVGRWGADCPISQIGPQEIDAYVAWMRAEPIRLHRGRGPGARRVDRITLDRVRSPVTINKYLISLGSILKLAARLTGAPAPKLPAVREDKRLPNPVSDQHVAALVDAAMTNRQPHIAEAIWIARWTGLRQAEILALNPDWIDEDERTARLPAPLTKGRREEVVYFNGAVWPIIHQLVKLARADGRRTLLFWVDNDGSRRPLASLRYGWEHALKVTGLAGKHRFHDLKASFVTNAAKLASGPVAQGLARHTSFQTTQVYIGEMNSEARRILDQMAENPLPKVPTIAARPARRRGRQYA